MRSSVGAVRRDRPTTTAFICGQEFGESNHWMETIYDNGSYVMDSNRILQPFDFADRTGTFDFSVDAEVHGRAWLMDRGLAHRKTRCSRRIPTSRAPHLYPKNGIGFEFDMPEACQSGYGPTRNSLRVVDEFRDYVDTAHTSRTRRASRPRATTPTTSRSRWRKTTSRYGSSDSDGRTSARSPTSRWH